MTSKVVDYLPEDNILTIILSLQVIVPLFSSLSFLNPVGVESP